MSNDGVQIDECKIKAVKKWPVLHTMPEVRFILGFINYYCQFLKGYTSIAHPLYELVLGDKASKKNKPVQWTNQCQMASDKIKDLAVPLLFWHLWALSSTSSSTLMPVGPVWGKFFTRSLMVKVWEPISEQKREPLPGTQIGILVLKWAVMTVFHEYLFSNQFMVKSYNNP